MNRKKGVEMIKQSMFDGLLRAAAVLVLVGAMVISFITKFGEVACG